MPLPGAGKACEQRWEGGGGPPATPPTCGRVGLRLQQVQRLQVLIAGIAFSVAAAAAETSKHSHSSSALPPASCLGPSSSLLQHTCPE